MSNKEADILQIRKYLNGELDGKAMHQLERRAMDDPFLMDALEGYEKAPANQQFNLSDINARLQKRITVKQQRRIIPWRLLAVAASILAFLTIGGFWLYYNKQQTKQPQIAVLVKPEVKTATDTIVPEAPAKKDELAMTAPVPKQQALPPKKTIKTTTPLPTYNAAFDEVAVNKPATVAAEQDTTPLNEMVVMEYQAQKKKDGNAVADKNVIKGTIVDTDNKLPIPGVSVRLAGTKKVAVTGIDGNFTLLVDSNRGKLVLTTTGFDTKEVNLYNFGSMGTIKLNPRSETSTGLLATNSPAKTAMDIQVNADVSNAKKIAANNTQPLQVQAAGVGAINSGNAKASYLNRDIRIKRTITGKVVAKDDGSPMAGVTVKIPGTSITTLTDATGHFTLPIDSSQTNLAFAFVGYEPKQVSLAKDDLDKTITLEPANHQLAEVAMTSPYSSKSDDSAVMNAHPRDGWDSYNKYLKENAASPDGKTGIVRLSFEIEPDGTIIGIKVTKSLSPACDKKAIDLINSGPVWIGRSNSETEKVRVKVKFGVK